MSGWGVGRAGRVRMPLARMFGSSAAGPWPARSSRRAPRWPARATRCARAERPEPVEPDVLLDGLAPERSRARRRSMSQTTATSFEASGVPVKRSTSSTLSGAARRSRSGHEVGESRLQTANGWNPARRSAAVGEPARYRSWARVALSARPVGQLVVQHAGGGHRSAGHGHVLGPGRSPRPPSASAFELRRGRAPRRGAAAAIVVGLVEQLAGEVPDPQSAQQDGPSPFGCVQASGHHGPTRGAVARQARTHPRVVSACRATGHRGRRPRPGARA